MVNDIIVDIESSPTLSKKGESSFFALESSSFSMCSGNYKVGDIIVYSENHECNHCFHKDYVTQWFLTNSDFICQY